MHPERIKHWRMDVHAQAERDGLRQLDYRRVLLPGNVEERAGSSSLVDNGHYGLSAARGLGMRASILTEATR